MAFRHASLRSHPIPSRPLRLIKLLIGTFDQRGGIAVRYLGQANADADRDVPDRSKNGCGNRGANLLGNALGALGFLDFR